MQHRRTIIYSTILIYISTILIHIVLSNLENGRNYLGITMGIPLAVIFLYQKLYKKQRLLQSFSISSPRWQILVFSILFPILMGLLLHILYMLWDMKFLFQESFFMLMLIGLTISSLSALLEEVVWRGNFHYYLRQSYSLPKVAIIVAAIWSLWHLPIGFMYKGYDAPLFGIVGYMGILFVLSIILTYTREIGRSTIPAALLHGMFNVFYLADGLQISISMEQVEWSKLAVLILAFIILSLYYRRAQR